MIRFVFLLNELQNPKYSRSASGAEKPIPIPTWYNMYVDRAVGVNDVPGATIVVSLSEGLGCL